MVSKGIVIHHVFRAQCLDDGTAYFGCFSHEDPEYGRDGNIPLNFGKKLQEKIAKHGRHRFAVTIWFSTPLREDALKKWRHLLKETCNHPMSLNESDDEHSAAIKVGMIDYFPDAAHRQALSDAGKGTQNLLGHVHTDEAKAKISAARKVMKWIHNPETNEEMQLELGEDLLTGFKFGRLKKKDRAKGPQIATLDISKLDDGQRARLPQFVLDAYAKQAQRAKK